MRFTYQQLNLYFNERTILEEKNFYFYLKRICEFSKKQISRDEYKFISNHFGSK